MTKTNNGKKSIKKALQWELRGQSNQLFVFVASSVLADR